MIGLNIYLNNCIRFKSLYQQNEKKGNRMTIQKLLITWLVLSIFIFSYVGCSSESQNKVADTSFDYLPALIENHLKQWNIPGLAVGIVKDGEIVFMQGFGYRDVEKQLPVTTKTLFPIASCSKAFTALSAILSAEDNLIDFDKPVREYIPNFQLKDKDATQKATLRDFLEHRSGLAGYRYVPALSGADRQEIINRLKFINPESEIRSKFSYSNLGYVIAGYTVGKVNGKSWEEFVSEKIFKPLGMKNTFFNIEEMINSGDYATPYANMTSEHPEPWQEIQNNPEFAPAGGIIADIESMMLWLKFNLNDGKVDSQQLVPSEKLQEMWKNHVELNPSNEFVENEGYAYGWYSHVYRGHRHVYHGGLGDGYISHVSFLPDDNIGIVVLTNLYYHHYCTVLINHIIDQMLDLEQIDHNAKELEGIVPYLAKFRMDHKDYIDKITIDPPDGFDLDKYAGTYSNPLYGKVEITTEDNKLTCTFEGGIICDLYYSADNVFALNHYELIFRKWLLTFQTDNYGKIKSFTAPLESGVEDYIFERVN